MSLTAAERETIITLNDEDELSEIWTAQRPWITKLRKNPSATLIEEGKHDGSVWARFEVPKELISVRPKRRQARPGAADHLRAAASKTPSREGVSEQNDVEAA